MSFDWPTVTLAEITSRIGDGLHGTPKYDDNGDYHFINGNNLSNGKIVINEKTKRTDESQYLKHKKDLNDRTLLVSINGTLGNIGTYKGEKVFLGKSACYLNVLPNVNKDYVMYILTSKHFQDYIHNLATGSTIKNVGLKLIREYEFQLPDITTQNKIANVLVSIDSKISVNQQINQNLEEMAQAIFKSWFVDFEPVKAKMRGEQPEGMDAATTATLFPDKLVESELGLTPEGWEIKPLYDIAEYINGAAYKKFEPNTNGLGFPIVKIVELKSGITDKTGFSTVKMPEKYKLNDKDILFSWSGNPDTSIDTFIWALGEAWLNQHIFKVIPKPIITRNYLLNLLKSMRSVFAEIARDKQTTGLGHVTVKDLKRLMVALPSKELLAKFDDAVSAIINQQFNLVKQNQNLEKLRDTMLPKLLSGELALTQEELTDES